jgi:hypothetical protein
MAVVTFRVTGVLRRCLPSRPAWLGTKTSYTEVLQIHALRNNFLPGVTDSRVTPRCYRCTSFTKVLQIDELYQGVTDFRVTRVT